MTAESTERPAEAEMETDMEMLLEDHADCSMPRSGDIRMGHVIQIDSNGALVDIGFKREGLVSAQDLEQMRRARMDEIQVGDEVPVLILRSQESDGYLAVSIHKARMAEDWLQAEQMMASGEVYETEVTGYNRGGLTVQFGRIRGFIPMSHIVGMPRHIGDAERKERLKDMTGQKIGLKVVEVDRRRRRLILSQRQAYRGWQRTRKRRLLKDLQEGERCHGVVTSLTDFGVFVDLGGADGLVHLSELSWGRIDRPGELVQVGDEVDVVVLSVDRERERIALSMKQLDDDPWTTVDQRYGEDDLVEGRVTQVSSIGAFVEIEPGIEGLLHVSELVGAPAVVPEEVLQPGDQVLVKILRIEKGRRRVGLSARRVRREEWENWAAEKADVEALEAAKAAENEALQTEAVAENEALQTEAVAEDEIASEDEFFTEDGFAAEDAVVDEPVVETEAVGEDEPADETPIAEGESAASEAA